MVLVVKSKIKDVAKGFDVSGDFAAALDAQVEQLIKQACTRASANGRKTIMAKDV